MCRGTVPSTVHAEYMQLGQIKGLPTATAQLSAVMETPFGKAVSRSQV